MEPSQLLEVHRIYHEALENEEKDPFRYGYVPWHWKKCWELMKEKDELWIFGGNRSSKTFLAAHTTVRSLLENPGSMIYCWSQTDETSKTIQQPAVWHFLPLEYKRKMRGQVEKIVYSKANGFTDKTFILPNGSQCVFKHYSQYIQNPNLIEGAKLGSPAPEWLNIGNWFDEYWIGNDLLYRMRARLSSLNAKLLLTYTPIDGYTETVREILSGAKTVESAPAELLGNESVPFIQQPKKENATVIYFHTKWNPYHDYERTKRDLKGVKREEVLIKAYGVPTRSASGKFPLFTRENNVVKHSELPFVKDPAYPVTRYLIVDPAGRKPWTMIWCAVDVSGTHYIYREWPDISYGEWAEIGKNDRGRAGPGQKPVGYGINDYKELILDLEQGEEIYERLIDPRMGKNLYAGTDGASTIIDDMADRDMIFYPAPGLDEEQGLQKIVDLISWNPSKPLDAANRPDLMVSDACEQFFTCMQNYTGNEGPDEAWKDFVDCARYMAVTELQHIDPSTMKLQAQGTGGY